MIMSAAMGFFFQGTQERVRNSRGKRAIGVRATEVLLSLLISRGRSDGAMVLGKLPVAWRPTIWIKVGQGPTALAVGAGGGCLDIFTLIYHFSPLSPSLWETARYRLKYCLKGPLNPKQPTNQTSYIKEYILDLFPV